MMQGTCRGCGCQDLSACWDEESGTPCFWVEVDLCSRCASTITDREMEILERVSLLQQATLLCLAENKATVLIVLQDVDNPDDLTYMAKTDRADVERMLRYLLETFAETPSIPTHLTLEVTKSPRPPIDLDRRN